MVPPAIAELLSPALMTLQAWADMDEDEPGELVDGHLEAEEVPNHPHEATAAWLVRMLGTWGAKRRAPVFGSEHKLAVSETRGRKPDVCMYAPGTRLGRGNISHTPPHLVIEIVSPRPRDILRDRRDKLREYARFGVKLYLIVDPQVRLFELYELGMDERYAWGGASADGKMTLPGCEGLELDLDALWAEVAWVVGDEAEAEGP